MDASSVDEVKMKYKKIQRVREGEKVPIVLVGNKIDKLKGATTSPAIGQAKALAEQWGCKYMGTSAKENTNVLACFEEGIRTVRKWRSAQEPSPKVKEGWCTLL